MANRDSDEMDHADGRAVAGGGSEPQAPVASHIVKAFPGNSTALSLLLLLLLLHLFSAGPLLPPSLRATVCNGAPLNRHVQ